MHVNHCPQKDKFLEENLYENTIIDTSCKVLFRLNNLLYEFPVEDNRLGSNGETSLFSSPCFRTLKPAENPVVSFFALGEGWHNYHHVFPWDYKASEFGFSGRFNGAAGFIDLMAWLGLAYDLKSPSAETIEKYRANKGDGTTDLAEKNSKQVFLK